jgi:hypothetical protein
LFWTPIRIFHKFSQKNHEIKSTNQIKIIKNYYQILNINFKRKWALMTQIRKFSIEAAKYLLKCIYKGHYRAAVSIEPATEENWNQVDEIKMYVRWVAPPEAMWRLFDFGLIEIHSSVWSLWLDLPNEQQFVLKRIRICTISLKTERKTFFIVICLKFKVTFSLNSSYKNIVNIKIWDILSFLHISIKIC